MSNRIVSPVDVVPDELTLTDRLDRFTAVLSEFSDTLDGSGRYWLFEMVTAEFATLRADIDIYVKFSSARE